MGYLDQWHDWARVVLFFVSLYSAITLLRRYFSRSTEWNTKTKDYWYAFFMWSLAGCVITVQAIYLDRPFTPGFVFLAAGVLVTGKGIHQKGDWGNNAK